jgi:protoporphyrinogen oxidase
MAISPPTPQAAAPVVIIGGGLTGISTALHLGRPYLLLERSGSLGGLARTDEREGFSFDRTGHWLHLRDASMRALCEAALGGELASVERRAKIYSFGGYTRYPFQANLFGLPPEVVKECLLGFVRTLLERGASQPRNFEEYILHHFGAGIARCFMVPYNTKLWGVHPSEITSAWCQRFVPIPDLEQVVGGAVGAGPAEMGYNVSFRYPRRGGIGAFSAALAARLDPARVRLHAEVEAVDTERREVVVAGERIAYSALVSTMPLPELVARTVAAPAEVREAAGRLRATGVRYLDVAARTQPPESFHWIYVPEERFPFYRVGIYSCAMPTMAPPGGSSYYVELASRQRPEGRAAADAEVASALAALVEARALTRVEDVVFAQTREIECAYVVFDEAYEESTRAIFEWLEPRGILSRGRYGSWVYNAMEDCLLLGRDAARRIDGPGGGDVLGSHPTR